MKQTQESVKGTVAAVLKIGRERKLVLEKMKAALESGNDSEALKFARLYVGITNEASHRVN